MIIQYSREVDNEQIETIIDGVVSVNDFKNKIYIHLNKNGRSMTKSYLKDDNFVYQMFLLNDNFKTLKKLI